MKSIVKICVSGVAGFLIGELVDTLWRMHKEKIRKSLENDEEIEFNFTDSIVAIDEEDFVETIEVVVPKTETETETEPEKDNFWAFDLFESVKMLIQSNTKEELEVVDEELDRQSDEAWARYCAYRLYDINDVDHLKVMMDLMNTEFNIVNPGDNNIIQHVRDARYEYFGDVFALYGISLGEIILYFAEYLLFDLEEENIDYWLDIILISNLGLYNYITDTDCEKIQILNYYYPENPSLKEISESIANNTFIYNDHFGIFGLDFKDYTESENDIKKLSLLDQYFHFPPFLESN